MAPNTRRSKRSAFGAVLCMTLVLCIKAKEASSSIESMESGLGGSPSRRPFDRSSPGDLPVEEGPVERKCDCVCGVSRHNRIIGGTSAGRMEFPWLVAMLFEGTFFCGGSLVTDRHFITAAHCFMGVDDTKVSIVLGAYDINNTTEKVQRRSIKTLTTHRDFNVDPDLLLDSDIAVVELDQPVNFGEGNIGTVCLPSETYREYNGENATVVGRGYTSENGPVSPIPLKLDLPIMSQDDCRHTRYGKWRISDNMMCAGFLNGDKSSCTGDSGGPLHLLITNTNTSSKEVVGIVSWAVGCARPNYPGVFTRVQQFVPWIREQIAGACECARV